MLKPDGLFRGMAPSAQTLGRVLLAASLVLPVAAQDKVDAAAKVDVDAVIKDLTGFLKDRKAEKDREALEAIDKLSAAYDKADKGDKRQIVKAFADVFKHKRNADGAQVYVRSCVALSKAGADGAKELIKICDNRTFKNEKEWQSFRAQAVEALGICADESPATVEFLKDLLRDRFDVVLAAAGKALGNYEKVKLETRKDIVEEIIKKFNSIYNGANSSIDPNDIQQIRFREMLTAIENDWNQALQRLTKQKFNKADEWQHWWNKNKKDDWDNEKGG
jgi:hypothetical protein